MRDLQSYLGNKNLKKGDVKLNYTKKQIEEYVKCSRDPIYFTRTYVKIINVDQGLVPFNLYTFQENMINIALSERFVICKMPRQVGKTTTVVATILWSVLFNENYSVAILANKERQAIEILSRIQLAYEHLPKWLQQGVKEWNKKDIELENRSKIIASSTSSSAIRGTSQNLVYLDEFAFVPNNIQHSFFSSVFPVISSGKTTKILITSTPNGMNLFYKLWMDSVEGRNSYERIDVHWSELPGRDEEWKRQTIANTSEDQFRQEFECEFLGSANTLIHPNILKNLAFVTPIESKNNLDIYERPSEECSYALVADTSRGVEGDFSAFVVYNISEVPYRVIAKYKCNTISPLLYPEVIYNVALKYNNAYVLVEINDNGQQIADILHYELEYENMLVTHHDSQNGASISGGFRRSIPGIRTTKQVKRIGCSMLKDLIENYQLLINDFEIIEELSNFVNKGVSFEAEEGFHDDLVMCNVLFAWLTRQPYFKELTDTDVRAKMLLEKQRMIEDDLLPFGIIDDGRGEEEIVTINTRHDFWYEPGNKIL
jgi:hypothetical protein